VHDPFWCFFFLESVGSHSDTHIRTYAPPTINDPEQNIDLESLWRAQQEEGKELDMDAFWDHVQVGVA
jgi:hypothetical protein